MKEKRIQHQEMASLIVFITQTPGRNDKSIEAFSVVGSQLQLELFLSRGIAVVTRFQFWDLCVLVQSR